MRMPRRPRAGSSKPAARLCWCRATSPSRRIARHHRQGGRVLRPEIPDEEWVNSDNPRPTLLAYAATKGAITNFSAGVAQLLAERGIRINSVAKRAGQPVEVAQVYVLLASDEASCISGARVAVTGGKPVL